MATEKELRDALEKTPEWKARQDKLDRLRIAEDLLMAKQEWLDVRAAREAFFRACESMRKTHQWNALWEFLTNRRTKEGGE